MRRRVARVDRISIRLDSMPTDARGFAKIWGTVITADSVLEYGPADGHPEGHFEFVPEATVFDKKAMASLRNAPITFLHPVEPVSAENSSRLTVGHIIDVKRVGDKLRALHQIEDAATIRKIRGGVVELSPGYTTELDDANGLIVDGRKMGAIQSGRLYNHQAIVPEARAGHDNAFTIDARILPADGLRIQIPGEQPMKHKIKFDGKTVEVDAETLAQIQKLTGGLGNSDGEHEEEEEEEEETEDVDKSDEGDDEDKGDADDDKDDADDTEDSAKDGAKGDPPSATNDAAPKFDAAAVTAQIVKDVTATLDAKYKKRDAASARAAIVKDRARSILPRSYSMDGRSTAQIMRRAIKEHDPDMVAEAKGLKGDALFGMFLGVTSTPKGGRTDARTAVAPVTGGSYLDAIEARNQRIDHVANCGQTGDTAVRCDAALKLIEGGKA